MHISSSTKVSFNLLFLYVSIPTSIYCQTRLLFEFRASEVWRVFFTVVIGRKQGDSLNKSPVHLHFRVSIGTYMLVLDSGVKHRTHKGKGRKCKHNTERLKACSGKHLTVFLFVCFKPALGFFFGIFLFCVRA